MKKQNRDYGFIASLFVIIAFAIFLVIEKIQTNDLESYLSTLAEKFRELVPEGKSRNLLAQRFDAFLGRVKNESVSPDELERVAVHILNLAAKDSVLNEEEALAILDLSKAYPNEFPAPVVLPKRTNINVEQTSNGNSAGEKQRLKIKNQNYVAVGERLNRVIALEKQLDKFNIQKSTGKDYLITYDDQIKIQISPKILQQLESKNAETVINEIRILQDEKLLIFKEELHNQVIQSLKQAEKSLHQLDSLSFLPIIRDSIPE